MKIRWILIGGAAILAWLAAARKIMHKQFLDGMEGLLNRYNPTGERFVAVALFLTEGEARAESYRLNAEARAGRSPFWFDSEWHGMTDLTVEEAAARLVRKGFSPPPARSPDDTGRARRRARSPDRGRWG